MIDFKNGSVFKLKQINVASVEKEVIPLLITNESIISAYKGMRDYVVFTQNLTLTIKYRLKAL